METLCVMLPVLASCPVDLMKERRSRWRRHSCDTANHARVPRPSCNVTTTHQSPTRHTRIFLRAASTPSCTISSFLS